MAQHDEHLKAMLELVVYAIDQTPSVDVLTAEPHRVSHSRVGHADLKLWIYDPQGHRLFSSAETEIPRELWDSSATPGRHPLTTRSWQEGQRLGIDHFRVHFAGMKPRACSRAAFRPSQHVIAIAGTGV